MKNLFLLSMLYFLILSGQTVYAQTDSITISPNHTTNGNGACPTPVSTVYNVVGVPDTCGVIITFDGGNYIQFTPDNANKKFTAIWSDVPQIVKVKVAPVPAGCFPVTIIYIPVMSVSGLAPNISGCPPSLVIGKSAQFDMTAQLLYLYKGVNDNAEVGEYQWEIFAGGAGWNLTSINQNGKVNKKAQIVTDNQNDATIRVRGKSICGKWSDWAYCIIGRFVQSPCPILYAPEYVVCEDMDPVGMLATITTGLSGYTYHWTWPPGWTGNATGPAGAAYPNGENGGTVTLVAMAFGKTSAPCTANIPLEPIEPATMIIGDTVICDDEPGLHKLDIEPPPSSTITWTVTPSNATTPSSGTGQSAYISASGSYNGKATITFTINTLCGTKTRQNSFFVGKPKISNVKVNGKPGTFVYICPTNWGSHWIGLELEGDSDNCIDDWNDFGTTATNYKGCKQFNFTLQSNPNNSPPYNCVFVNAIASNDCGVGSQTIIACPSYWACNYYEYKFLVSPNPANTYVNVELFLDKDGDRETVDFDYIQLIDQQGNLLQQQNVTGHSIQLDVSNLNKGIYYLRTWIDEGYVMEQLLIERY